MFKKLSAEAEILSEAQRKIRAHGWEQGRFGDEEIGFCIEGALGPVPVTPAAINVAQTLSDWASEEGFDSVTDWNDADCRTERQVLQMLDRAAKLYA